MPRFFFHIRGACQELSRDEVGLEFPDVETACRMTFHAAQGMLPMFALCGRDPRDYSIEVVNIANEMVFSLTFAKARSYRKITFTNIFG